jgi:hypothetical protein
MKEYVVYRHGWNVVNQNPEHGLPEQLAVLRIKADNPEEACRLARRSLCSMTNTSPPSRRRKSMPRRNCFTARQAEPTPRLDASCESL